MQSPRQIVRINLSIRDLGHISVCKRPYLSQSRRKTRGGKKVWWKQAAIRRDCSRAMYINEDQSRSNKHTWLTSITIFKGRTRSHFSPQSTPTHFLGATSVTSETLARPRGALRWQTRYTSVVEDVVVSACVVPEKCLPPLIWNHDPQLCRAAYGTISCFALLFFFLGAWILETCGNFRVSWTFSHLFVSACVGDASSVVVYDKFHLFFLLYKLPAHA